ncbi:MAG: hypothetical protein LBQ40_04535 [Clostridiales bacterium]|jgi:hypothetical protein|nr:hypothetical protein [Clostridiales bacterium]
MCPKTEKVFAILNNALQCAADEPLIDCRIEIGDNAYAQQVNQTAAQPASDKFGKFLENYLQGMGKYDILIGKTYGKPSDFIGHFGARVFGDDGKEYIVTNMSYVNRNWDYDVVYQLNENHARKNNSYQAPQSIRENTAIPLSGIKERKTFIKQKIKISLKAPIDTPPENDNSFLIDKKILLSALIPNMVDSKYYPQIAAVYPTSDNAPIINPKLLANIAQFTVGNMVCVNLKFYDNAEAGKRKVNETHYGASDPNDDDNNTDYLTDISEQIPMVFTNAFGEVCCVTVLLSSTKYYNLQDYQSNNNIDEINKTLVCYKTMQNLPALLDQDYEVI